MPRKYDPNHCQNSVRATIVDSSTTITLMGRHAHEWSIMKSNNGTIIVTSYPNRIMASKDWKELCKAYK